MIKIKDTKSPMKNIKTEEARLRGARPVYLDGAFIGYTQETFREQRAGSCFPPSQNRLLTYSVLSFAPLQKTPPVKNTGRVAQRVVME
jgi:hypothetical protein